MKLFIFSFLLFSSSIVTAQSNGSIKPAARIVTVNCNNWLSTPSNPSFVSVGNLAVTGNKITIEAVINRTQPYSPGTGANNAGDVVSKHTIQADINYCLRPNNGYITTSNGFYATPDICGIELNKTYHIAMVYDGTTLKFYRNGFLMSQLNATGNLVQNGFNTQLGLYPGTPFASEFLGYMNEVRIWNVARTQTQLQTYMNSSLPNPTIQTGLLAYYTFDNLLNKQGNPAWNGTLNGAASINNTNPDCSFAADSCKYSVLSNIINDYTPVLSQDVCKNLLTVEDASAFNNGDTVLIAQMKGAVPDSTNTAAFGNILNYKNAGNYEINYVKNKTGNIIELKNFLIRSYDIPDGKVQLVRVPYYNGSVSISSTLTCLPWDGSKGGIVVLNVRDTVNLLADIDVSGKGFRGGIGYGPNTNVLNCNLNEYYYPASDQLSGYKGESIAAISAAKNKGKGKLGNGGGGGQGHNSGGGGGSNGGIGGFGGYQLNNCGGAPFDNRGIGGLSLTNNSALNKLFLGGGGGAGQADGPVIPSGGNGGGAVIILSGYLKANAHQVKANGADGAACTLPVADDCHDGMGGAGGGGTVILAINNFLDNNVISKSGGKGASVLSLVTAAGKIGAGGGGGGGTLLISKPSLPSNMTSTNTGGLNGDLLLAPGDPWGATAGTNGNDIFNVSIPFSTIEFKKNIDSVRFTYTNTLCNHFDFNGLAYTNTSSISTWQWYFGDAGTANTQNASHNYASNGPFNVKLVVTDINGCKDSITKTISLITVTADAGLPQSACGTPSAIFNLHASATGTGLTYSWTPAAGLNDSHLPDPIATISSTTTYTVNVTNATGCSSSSSVTVTIKSSTTGTSNISICEGSAYQGHTTSGIYVNTFTAANGCDSVHTLNLTVKPKSLSTINASICDGTTYAGHTTAGTYTDTYTAANGCDSIRTLNLTIKPRSFTTNNQSICEGASYEGHTTTGTYVSTLVAANGCDSVYTLNLTVKPKSFTTNNQSICEGTSYEGHTTTGTYVSTLVAANGCDSVYTLNLTVKPKAFSTVNASVCQGQAYEGYTTAGTFTDNFIAANGCDSIRTLNLIIKPTSFSTVTTTICEGQSYNGHTTAGTYTDTYTAANGCDSIRTLNLTIKPRSFTTNNQSICEGASYEGHTTTGTYVNTLVAANGCDSIYTLNLIVKPKSFTNNNQSICEGSSYEGHTTTGTYVSTLVAANGCDSIYTLNLIVKPKSFSTVNTAVCQGQAYEGYTTAGTFTDTFIAANGCDSIRTLNLTIKPKSFSTVTTAICEGQSYDGHTTAGTYTDTYTAANGCDSIRTLNLTIKPKSFTNNVQSICEGQVYQGHNTTGTYVTNLTAVNGCDSVYTLILTVKPKSFTNLVQSICEGQSFEGHTTSGTYVSTFVAANGCDSVHTLVLTVNNKSFTTDNRAICEGESYQGHNAAGIYISTFMNAAGCDSTYTLNLSLKPNPVIKASKSNDLDCSNLSAKLSVTGGVSYTWSPAATLNSSTGPSPVASPLQTTEYYVEGTGVNGCTGHDTIKIIKTGTGQGTIYIPNTFSPNGDYKNDCFKIVFFGAVQKFHMVIYNRWGEKVFETTNPDNCWNGTYKGKPALEAAYVYYITAKTSCGNFTQKGSLLLLR